MPLSVWFQNLSRLKALANKNQENRAFLFLLKHALDVLMLTNTGYKTFQLSCSWAIKKNQTPSVYVPKHSVVLMSYLSISH